MNVEIIVFFFFFQAEDGIRDKLVTGVQTCALPISIEIWVKAKNPGGHLKPGTSVQVSMIARSVPDALTVPAEALLTEQGATSVMVAGPDGHAHKKTVKIG